MQLHWILQWKQMLKWLWAGLSKMVRRILIFFLIIPHCIQSAIWEKKSLTRSLITGTMFHAHGCSREGTYWSCLKNGELIQEGFLWSKEHNKLGFCGISLWGCIRKADGTCTRSGASVYLVVQGLGLSHASCTLESRIVIVHFSARPVLNPSWSCCPSHHVHAAKQ